MLKNKGSSAEKQEKSRQLEKRLVALLVELKRRVDRRLVMTFLGLVMAMVMHRHRNHGLLLSELGSHLLGAEYGEAGAKRISNLVHSQKWEARLIEEFLWRQGTERVEALRAEGERPLVIWEESVLEKPESIRPERLCAVRSTKAARLKRIKPGYFNPPRADRSLCPDFTGCRSWWRDPGGDHPGSYALVDYSWGGRQPEANRRTGSDGTHR